MKKLTILNFLLLYLSSLFAQEKTGIEKSIWGIEVGINPLAIHNESRLTNDISLRSEIGFGFRFSSGDWAVVPQLILEPRYYHNLKRRSSKNKQIRNNSGNYLTIRIGYLNGNLSIKSEGVNVYSLISIAPMYGLRRNIGKNFKFEVTIGPGYGWTFKEYTRVDSITNETYTEKETGQVFLLGHRLSVGYIF